MTNFVTFPKTLFLAKCTNGFPTFIATSLSFFVNFLAGFDFNILGANIKAAFIATSLTSVLPPSFAFSGSSSLIPSYTSTEADAIAIAASTVFNAVFIPPAATPTPYTAGAKGAKGVNAITVATTGAANSTPVKARLV